MPKSMTIRTWYLNGFHVVDGASPVGTTPRGRPLFGDHQVRPRGSNSIDPLMTDLPDETTPVEWRRLGYRPIAGTVPRLSAYTGVQLLNRDQVEPLTMPTTKPTPPADPRDGRLWRKGQSEVIKSLDPLSEEFHVTVGEFKEVYRTVEQRIIEIQSRSARTFEEWQREKLLRHVENAMPNQPAGPAWTLREVAPPDAFGRSAWHNPIWGT